MEETSGTTAYDIGSVPVNGTFQTGNAIVLGQFSLVPTDNGVQKFAVNDPYLPANFSDVRMGIGWDPNRRWNGGIDEVAMYS